MISIAESISSVERTKGEMRTGTIGASSLSMIVCFGGLALETRQAKLSEDEPPRKH